MCNKIEFLKIKYDLVKDKDALAVAVNKYSKAVARKLSNKWHLNYADIEDYAQNFNYIFYTKIIIKHDLKCDPSTYFYACCRNWLYNYLNIAQNRFNKKVALLYEETDMQAEFKNNNKKV